MDMHNMAQQASLARMRKNLDRVFVGVPRPLPVPVYDMPDGSRRFVFPPEVQVLSIGGAAALAYREGPSGSWLEALILDPPGASMNGSRCTIGVFCAERAVAYLTLGLIHNDCREAIEAAQRSWQEVREKYAAAPKSELERFDARIKHLIAEAELSLHLYEAALDVSFDSRGALPAAWGDSVVPAAELLASIRAAGRSVADLS